jgi:hypothetical protein
MGLPQYVPQEHKNFYSTKQQNYRSDLWKKKCSSFRFTVCILGMKLKEVSFFGISTGNVVTEE